MDFVRLLVDAVNDPARPESKVLHVSARDRDAAPRCEHLTDVERNREGLVPVAERQRNRRVRGLISCSAAPEPVRGDDFFSLGDPRPLVRHKPRVAPGLRSGARVSSGLQCVVQQEEHHLVRAATAHGARPDGARLREYGSGNGTGIRERTTTRAHEHNRHGSDCHAKTGAVACARGDSAIDEMAAGPRFRHYTGGC